MHALAQTAFRIKRHKSLCSHRRANRVRGPSIADASSLRLIGAGKHEAALLRLLGMKRGVLGLRISN